MVILVDTYTYINNNLSIHATDRLYGTNIALEILHWSSIYICYIYIEGSVRKHCINIVIDIGCAFFNHYNTMRLHWAISINHWTHWHSLHKDYTYITHCNRFNIFNHLSTQNHHLILPSSYDGEQRDNKSCQLKYITNKQL